MRVNPALPLILLLLTADASRAETPPPDAASMPVEATSLLGEPLRRPVLPEAFRAEQEKHLAEARARLRADPDDADALVWVGRRTAYLGRYNEAIEIFTEGIARHPEDARFLRHRGHRYLTVRRLQEAAADFERAAELLGDSDPVVEPDGLPNAQGIPTSTLHGNVWYHLGLARYLQGDFQAAALAYEKCLAVSEHPDMRVATLHWLYMTLRRLGRKDDAVALLAPIRADLELLESFSYHRLLMLYKETPDERSLLPARADEALDQVTLGYGAGAWELYNSRPERAAEIFREVLASGPWAAFGTLAAEAELARLNPSSSALQRKQ